MASNTLFDDGVPVRAEPLAGDADVRVDHAARIQRVVRQEDVVRAIDFHDTGHRRRQESAACRNLRARWQVARVREARWLRRQEVDVVAPRDAEILLLKYGERWSYRQIAARLGVTEKAVDSRLLRAREALRLELAAVGIREEET